ncbi:MAG: hypothetical protein QY326_01455 [Bdellovibrionota bacterium]|nr:MAG: hypothetical protein QY326_01455 [Bdellovibrionota bacterium]
MQHPKHNPKNNYHPARQDRSYARRGPAERASPPAQVQDAPDESIQQLHSLPREPLDGWASAILGVNLRSRRHSFPPFRSSTQGAAWLLLA